MELLHKNQIFLKELLNVHDKIDKTSRSYIIREFNNSDSPTKVRDIAHILNAPISVILAILEETKTATCITYKRNNPNNKTAECDYIRARSILREIDNRRIKEKEETNKSSKKRRSGKKKTQSSSREGDSMGTDIDKITDRVGEFVAKYFGGDDEKFVAMFEDFIHGDRVLDTMQLEIGCYGKEIEERFKDCIELIGYLDPVKHQEYEELYKKLPKAYSEIAVCDVIKEYEKVQAGEETVHDAMDHLHCTLHAYEVAVDAHKKRVNEGRREYKMSKKYSSEYNASIAPDMFKRYIHDERIVDIAESYGHSDGWASAIIRNYVKNSDDPEIKLQYEAQKAKNLQKQVKRDIVDVDEEIVNDDIKESKEEEPAAVNVDIVCEDKIDGKEEKENKEVKADEHKIGDEYPHIMRVFEANGVIEVDLYKDQKHSGSDLFIFPNKIEAMRNLDGGRNVIETFVNKNIKFREGMPRTDMILYVSDMSDIGLLLPVMDFCSGSGVVVSANLFDDYSKRFQYFYGTAKKRNREFYNMFPGISRVETLNCSLQDLVSSQDEFFEIKEIVSDMNGANTFSYLLLCMDLEPLKEIYASRLPEIILERKQKVTICIRECKFANGKLTDLGEDIMPFRNY